MGHTIKERQIRFGRKRQVEAGGGKLLGEVQEDFNGKFAWFLDPDGRKVELWEPAEGY